MLHYAPSGAAGSLDEAAETVLAQRLREAGGEAVVDDPPLLAVADESGGAQDAQRVADRVLVRVQSQGQITDAELFDQVEAVEDPPGACPRDPPRIDGVA